MCPGDQNFWNFPPKIPKYSQSWEPPFCGLRRKMNDLVFWDLVWANIGWKSQTTCHCHRPLPEDLWLPLVYCWITQHSLQSQVVQWHGSTADTAFKNPLSCLRRHPGNHHSRHWLAVYVQALTLGSQYDTKHTPTRKHWEGLSSNVHWGSLLSDLADKGKRTPRRNRCSECCIRVNSQRPSWNLQAGAHRSGFPTPHFAVSKINRNVSGKFWIFCL